MMDQVYVITGASSDIGLEYIKRLEANKIKTVALCQYHSNSQTLQELKSNCKFVRLELFQCDLSDEKATENFISELAAQQLQVTHILHLAACRLEYMKLSKFDWQRTQKELTVQVNSFAQLLKYFLPKMSKNKYGKIVAMLSACTLGVPPKFMSDYIISKYALLGLVKSAASEYGGKGISINAISPNMMETKFLSNIDSRIVEMTAQNCTMKRNIKVDEVLDSISFLMSSSSDYINGINLNLTGGDR